MVKSHINRVTLSKASSQFSGLCKEFLAADKDSQFVYMGMFFGVAMAFSSFGLISLKEMGIEKIDDKLFRIIDTLSEDSFKENSQKNMFSKIKEMFG